MEQLENLTNEGMLDQMLTDKIIHDNLLFGSYGWKWSQWIRTNQQTQQSGFAKMTAKLTLRQYNTIKSIWTNNNQGVTFDKFLEATCLLKDLEYDPAIHELAPPKVPLKQHIKRSEAGLAESKENTHKHEYKRTEQPVTVFAYLEPLCRLLTVLPCDQSVVALKASGRYMRA